MESEPRNPGSAPPPCLPPPLSLHVQPGKPWQSPLLRDAAWAPGRRESARCRPGEQFSGSQLAQQGSAVKIIDMLSCGGASPANPYVGSRLFQGSTVGRMQGVQIQWPAMTAPSCLTGLNPVTLQKGTSQLQSGITHSPWKASTKCKYWVKIPSQEVAQERTCPGNKQRKCLWVNQLLLQGWEPQWPAFQGEKCVGLMDNLFSSHRPPHLVESYPFSIPQLQKHTHTHKYSTQIHMYAQCNHTNTQTQKHICKHTQTHLCKCIYT